MELYEFGRRFSFCPPVEEGRKVGHTFTQPDLIIAATGLRHGLRVVTRDITDYQRTHVALFNPWVDAVAP